MKPWFLAGIFLLGCGALNASIIFTPGNNPQSNEENVLFNLSGLIGGPALTVTGQTQQSGFLVNFTGTENLITPSAGQARVEASDGAFTQLGINLGTTATFTDIIFNLNTVNSTPGTATITVTEVGGPGATFALPVGAGSNFLTITTAGGELMTGVTISSNVAINDIRQTRISGAAAVQAIPEPISSALVGTGLISLFFIRRRARR
ncbi:MAG: protein sorting domain protein [Bryobacterales bacterium]|nr:protein sorting domain protein [Bryobacterales bacterium]